MDWSEYVTTLVDGRNQTEIAAKCGVHQTTISRWMRGKGGKPTVETAVAFARACDANPLEALAVLDVIKVDDVVPVVHMRPSARELSDADLVAELKRRLETREMVQK